MRSEKDVNKNLTALLKTLTLAYDEIYERILAQEESGPQIALNAFRWIQCSNEPLSFKTLLDAVMVEIDSSGEFSQNYGAIIDSLPKPHHFGQDTRHFSVWPSFSGRIPGHQAPQG